MGWVVARWVAFTVAVLAIWTVGVWVGPIFNIHGGAACGRGGCEPDLTTPIVLWLVGVVGIVWFGAWRLRRGLGQ